jgi:hypothetical protein
MPGETGVTVVTTLVCSFCFACEAAGALGARHSLRPHWAKDLRKTRADHAARSRRRVLLRHCEERKRRSNPAWIASLALAMTDGLFEILNRKLGSVVPRHCEERELRSNPVFDLMLDRFASLAMTGCQSRRNRGRWVMGPRFRGDDAKRFLSRVIARVKSRDTQPEPACCWRVPRWCRA